MSAYYCIVNLPGVPVREIAAINAADDAAAHTRMIDLSAGWAGFETIALYEGERPVSVLANPRWGFPPEPLEPGCQAA
ncbi:hypothetical protein GGQ87_001125 [Brevundimonas alba]|uniref:Uncharacterized protein n=1 Tax=Brevundimonas alba TaxID=74314 RepID=A0A7X6BMX6_9CAUL|nr:hypothetical protein [Brevundimonas alba]